jgi:antirestriction protein ArdC
MAYDSKVYDVITNRIIELLEQKVVPWHKPWAANIGYPKNLITDYPYRGINVFLLNAMPFNSPYWVSYNQVKKLGGQIIGEELRKSTPVIFFKWYEIDTKKQPDNKEVEKDNLAGDQTTNDKRKIPFIRYYRVYNVEQCLGLDEYIPEIKNINDLVPLRDCDEVINKMKDKPEINHGGDKAFYNPRIDSIQIPQIQSFDDIENYYSTLFHELTHSTGHEHRLKRKGVFDIHAFGDPVYSLEELVAEMGASFLCAMTGIENKTINNSAGYIANWLDKLKDDKKIIVIAGAQAQKACDYILNINQKSN